MKTLQVFIFCFGLFSANSLFAQTHIDLTGGWELNVQTDMGSGSPTFQLKQDAEGNLTGTYEGQLGESEVKGTLKGNVFHIEFSVQDNVIMYDGTVENDALSGKVVLGSMATGTFTGKRKKG
ncbi:hypothetical protein [Arundinibacter roseus]|uniref:Extracellular endo-alpha-(1->5)-L-arabinanase C-terminal domain-containing protein n=1 Tax=Arundinibacter roseus TaxID=2070510 RepID=A0A4R4KNA5_9BACT|nr:hypothetical protein [Arundinibacter roseus]TDB68031.1 hypothetical protein EZE20_03655 [Arundinibacter roseus]